MKETKRKKVVSKAASEAASALGKIGGSRTKKKYGKKHFAEIGRKGLMKRYNKLSTVEPVVS